MTLARTWSLSLAGVEGFLVEVEADLAQGLPFLTIVGLPDAAVTEARDRVRAAVVNSGHAWPARRITVGLSPASVRKAGAGFDLAIATAVLAAAGIVPAAVASRHALLGELGLDGTVRPVRGVLPAALAARAAGIAVFVVPAQNLAEARLVTGLATVGVASLVQLVGLLNGTFGGVEPPVPGDCVRGADETGRADLDQVIGQELGRYAIEVAGAGGHHLLMVGPPGCGKTMLAERLPSVLPDLDGATSLEVTAVHSVAGTLPGDLPLIRRPPLRSPHHSATLAALIGGGSGTLRPGAVSQAHRGVLFLDEAPEFSPHVLDALRQPLESGVVEIARARHVARFPARFQLVLAANPCPCGRGARGAEPCDCTTVARRRYLQRLSGPLVDRMDIRVTMVEVPRVDLLEPVTGESSARVAERVAAARARQAARLRDTPWMLNAHVPGWWLREHLPLPRGLRSAALTQGGPETGRGLDKVLRLAWTIADLRDRASPGSEEIELAGVLRDAR